MNASVHRRAPSVPLPSPSAESSCEGEGLRWPDGAESAALLLWSALFGRFALWTSTFGRHDQSELTVFVDRVVDAVLRDGNR